MAEVEIRRIRPEDAGAALQVIATIAAEGRYILTEVHELRPVAEQEQRIAAHDPNEVGWFVAEVDGQVIGQITAHRGGRAKVRHKADIGLGILPEWRGQGIGAQLMLRVEEWAREVGVQRLALEVFTENERAKRLYERLGYEVEGLHKGAAKQGDEFIDEYSMAKWLRSPSV